MRTLRCALAALALLLVPSLAHAQLIPSFGVTGGVNFASLEDATSADLDNSTGYHAGVFLDLGIGPLNVRPAVLYVWAGSFQDNGLIPLLSDEPSLSFIAVPVDFKFSLATPLVKPYALVGPEFRFTTGDFAEFENVKNTTVAINAGIGAELGAIIGPSAFLELRYGFDVSGLADENFGTTSDESLKVNLFMLRVGVGL